MSNKPLGSSILRLAAFAIFLVLAGCGGGGGKPDYSAHDIQGVMPDLAFNLTDENGDAVDASDYAGDLRLLFFGYTHCPDICPATMARIRAALGALDEAQRDKVAVLFVSVDPERDSLERIRRFTSIFGPDFIGLTGSQAQLKALSKRYRVTYSYGEPNDHGFYLVSHSSALFAFDTQGRARLLANQSETVDQLSQDLKTLLAHLDDKKS